MTMPANTKPYRANPAFAGTQLLILLFVYAACSKLLEFTRFQHQLYNQNIPHGLAATLAYTLPVAELTSAGLLVFDRSRFAGLLSGFLLLILFSGYIGLVLLGFWDRVPCSCGGILNHLSWTTHFIFNLAFLGINTFCLYENIRQAHLHRTP
jgi:putative oxidoreductase